jgi:hypothetical protein
MHYCLVHVHYQRHINVHLSFDDWKWIQTYNLLIAHLIQMEPPNMILVLFRMYYVIQLLITFTFVPFLSPARAIFTCVCVHRKEGLCV